MTACCIRDYCGKPFDPNVPETRDTSTLRAFWQRYCPEHRLAPEGQTIITEVRAATVNTDLLDALKIAYQSLSQYKAGDELCQIRAAIAKAEGKD